MCDNTTCKGWQSTLDMLPPDGWEVLIAVKGSKEANIGVYYAYLEEWYYADVEEQVENVRYWMHLPEVPE